MTKNYKAVRTIFIKLLTMICFLTSLAQGADDYYRPWDHLWYGTRDIPDVQNAWVLGAGGVATALALIADHRVRDYFSRTDRFGVGSDIGDFWGTGIPGAAIGLLSISYGLLWKKPHEVDSGEAHLEALVANTVYTTILKYSIRRPRPDTGTRNAFPSGHTSTAFTTAGSLMDMYGPWVGVPALMMGTVTAISRMDDNRHWLSDTLFGATLGLIVGHAYTHHHKDSEKPQTVFVFPYFESRSDFGLAAKLSI